MLELDNYDNSSVDTKETELIDEKSKKDENFPIKNDINKSESSFNESMEQINSLTVKEKPLTNKYPNVKPKTRQGNTIFCCILIFTILYRIMGIFKFLY